MENQLHALLPRTSRLFTWREHARSLVESLPQFLTWTSGQSLVQSACEIHENGVLSRLSLWAQASGSNVQDVFLQLAKPGQERLLHAPQFLLLLRSTKNPDLDQLKEYHTFIEAEEYLCGKKDCPPAGAWTALGDRYFPVEGDHPRSYENSNPLLSNAGSEPCFVREIFIDVRSPNLKKVWILLQNLGELEMYRPEEVASISQILQRGLDYIESVSPTVAAMISSCVYVIGAGRSSAMPDQVASMSLKRAIGYFVLANPLSANWRPGDICDALIHEAIHALVYRLEMLTPVFTDPSVSSTWIDSPWSGRPLSLYSLVHACFVWFGLWNFWIMDPHALPEAVDLRKRAEGGFLRGPLSSRIAPEVYACLQPEIRVAIERMFEHVNSKLHDIPGRQTMTN